MANLMPSGAVQTFTGSDNTTISSTDFAIPLNQGSGGGATIQTNQCRVRTGSTAFNRISIRLNRATTADMEVDFVWTVPAAGQMFGSFYLRSVTAMDTQQGYEFTMEASTMTCNKVTAYSTAATLAAAVSHGFTAGQVVHSRFAIFGTAIKARTWLQSGSEPTGSWMISVTDSTYTTGFAGLTVSSGSTGSKDFFIDTFNCTDTITPSMATLTLTGAITPAGALTKTVTKLLAGAMTPTGALTKIKVVTRSFAGAITPTGALTRSVLKNFGGTLTPAGALTKKVTKLFTGAITPTATTVKTAKRKFAGAITPTAAVSETFLGRVFGRPGIVVMSMLRSSTATIRHRRG